MKDTLIRIALIFLGVYLMYLESSYQDEPGVGFAGALILFLAAAFWGHKTENDL